MKYIRMTLASNGTGAFKEQEIYENENLATRLEINFQLADAEGYYKWADFVLADGTKMTLPLIANQTTADILTIDMDDSLTVEGPMLIQPFATKLVNGQTVKKIWDMARIIVHYSINNTGEVALANPDLIAQLFATKISYDGQNSNIDKLTFNATTLDTTELLEGEMRWNAQEHTLDLGMDGAGIVQQVGMETFYPHAKNVDTENILNGMLVEYVGTLGNSGVMLIKRATATLQMAHQIMGVATEDIPVANEGRITWFGQVRAIQTNGANYGEIWADGDILYNNPYHLGGLTKVRPVAPFPIVIAAVVMRAHETNGSLFVRPSFMPHIFELSDVEITNPIDGHVLKWNATNLRWENSIINSSEVAYGDGTVEEKLMSLGATITVSDTEPENPSINQLWLEI